MSNIFAILTTVLAISIPQVDVETLDGTRLSGELRALSVEQVQIETPDGEKTVSADRLMSVAFPKTASAKSRGRKIVVTLVDGSRIVVRNYQVKGEEAQLLVARKSSAIKVPTRDVNSVRFSGDPGSLNEAWKQLQEKPSDSDRLVIAKGDSLDYHAGSLGEVTDSRVVFTLDGDSLKIKRKKIFGITYYHSAGRVLPKQLGRLVTSNGNRWSFVTIEMDGENFKLKTPTGLKISLSISKIKRINFAEGKIVYLSDMKPESIVWTPYLAMKGQVEKDEVESRATLFSPKFNKSFQAGPLILDGKQYSKGLAIHSRSVITYQLGKKYGRLTATTGIADRVRPQGHVQLKIEADGRTLFDREISGTEAALPIDLDLAQADRLTITVDYGKKIDIADRLILGDAKVME